MDTNALFFRHDYNYLITQKRGFRSVVMNCNSNVISGACSHATGTALPMPSDKAVVCIEMPEYIYI